MLEPVKEKKEKKSTKKKCSVCNMIYTGIHFCIGKIAPPQPKTLDQLECKHDWRWMNEQNRTWNGTGGFGGTQGDRFYCTKCLKIECK